MLSASCRLRHFKDVFGSVSRPEECLDDLGRRWRADWVAKELVKADEPPAIRMYEVLKPQLSCKEALRELSGAPLKEAMMFDEYHPGRPLQKEIARSFSEFHSQNSSSEA